MRHPAGYLIWSLKSKVFHHYHPKKVQSDKPDPDPSSPQSMLLTVTTATPTKNPTNYPSMVLNSIIFSATHHHPCTSTGYLSLRITYYCPSDATSVSPPDRPTRVLSIDPSLTPSLLPCADTKEVPSPRPSSPPHPDLKHVLHKLPLSLICGTVSSPMPLFNPGYLTTPAPTSEPSSLTFVTEPPLPPPRPQY